MFNPFNIFKKKPQPEPTPYVGPVFDIPYEKLYEADGRDEGVNLTAKEASELLCYIQYLSWLTNPPRQ